MLEKHWKSVCPWAVCAQLQEESAHQGGTRTSSRAPSVIPADVYGQSSRAGKTFQASESTGKKPPRDIWAISRMVSDKSSLSFYSLWGWICGRGLLLHKISTRCAEKSVKSRILKAFNIAPSFDENSKQTTTKKIFLYIHLKGQIHHK